MEKEKEKSKKGRKLIYDKRLTSLSIRLSLEEIEKLDKFAGQQKKTKSAVIRDFISSI